MWFCLLASNNFLFEYNTGQWLQGTGISFTLSFRENSMGELDKQIVAELKGRLPAREHAFDRFSRGGGNFSGLGLAIVKSDVERHCGTITLSEGDGGKGLRVTVVSPLHPLSSAVREDT